jgi:hypothetical protein
MPSGRIKGREMSFCSQRKVYQRLAGEFSVNRGSAACFDITVGLHEFLDYTTTTECLARSAPILSIPGESPRRLREQSCNRTALATVAHARGRTFNPDRSGEFG